MVEKSVFDKFWSVYATTMLI